MTTTATATKSLSDIYFEIKAGLRVGRGLRDYMDLLSSVDYDHPELSQYIVLDSKKFHRSVVVRDRFLEMVVITWLHGQESGLHGHPGDCIYKVLRGSLREDLYTRKAIKHSDLEAGDCGYISDVVGYHNVGNVSKSGFAVSIHVYCPSFDLVD